MIALINKSDDKMKQFKSRIDTINQSITNPVYSLNINSELTQTELQEYIELHPDMIAEALQFIENDEKKVKEYIEELDKYVHSRYYYRVAEKNKHLLNNCLFTAYDIYSRLNQSALIIKNNTKSYTIKREYLSDIKQAVTHID